MLTPVELVDGVGAVGDAVPPDAAEYQLGEFPDCNVADKVTGVAFSHNPNGVTPGAGGVALITATVVPGTLQLLRFTVTV